MARQTGIELKCTDEEIKRYIGILLYLGALKLPQLRMAWSKDLKLTAITDSMPRGRFEKIKQCLHFNDNAKQLKKEIPTMINSTRSALCSEFSKKIWENNLGKSIKVSMSK